MHKVRVFLNGAASASRSHDWRGDLARSLFRSELEFVSPPSLEELQKELRRAALDAVDVVVSVGGDGTFNTLLQELGSTNTTFLVVPAGTANDLARELGITSRIKKAVEYIRKNEASKIDLISINGRLMATNGGIGIVGDVAAHVNDWRRRVPGFRSAMTIFHHHVYTATLAGQLAFGRLGTYSISIESPEYTRDVKTPLLLVNNQPYLGGSFPVAPKTRNDDGTFNVTLFTHRSRIAFIEAVYRVKEGLPVDQDPDIVSFETSRLTIQSRDEKPLAFFGDGEFLGCDRRIEATIRPSALKVFRPSLRPFCPAALDGNPEPNIL